MQREKERRETIERLKGLLGSWRGDCDGDTAIQFYGQPTEKKWEEEKEKEEG
jgi:hypothetical protein